MSQDFKIISEDAFVKIGFSMASLVATIRPTACSGWMVALPSSSYIASDRRE